jgi:hypothetical protein
MNDDNSGPLILLQVQVQVRVKSRETGVQFGIYLSIPQFLFWDFGTPPLLVRPCHTQFLNNEGTRAKTKAELQSQTYRPERLVEHLMDP